jgi:hypothetical protein
MPLRASTLAVAVLLALSLSAVGLPTAAHLYAPPTTGVLVPLFMYPNGDWQTVAQVKAAHPAVPVAAIINPSEGPGSKQDPSFVSGISTLHNAGVLVLGYVYTSYTSRAISSVEADVTTYHNLYNVDGILVDEMMNIPGYESYYSQLTAYARSYGYYVLGNPGATVPASYIGTADSIIIYESPGAPTLSLMQQYSSYPKAGFAICAYAIPSLDLSYLASAKNYLGWIYLTNGVLPNPYSSISSYLSSLVAALDPGTGSPPPSGLTLTVNTADLGGSSFGGIWASIQSGGSTLATGFTPLSYSIASGTQYTVAVSNYGSYLFDHWSTGSTSPSVTVTATTSTTLTAYYRTPSTQGKVALSVVSATLNGSAFGGLWASIQSGGSTVASGYTPLSYNATAGTTYSVTATSYGQYVFSRWSTGSTSPTISVTPTTSTTLTAYYTTPTSPTTVALTVKSVNLAGTPLNGMYVVIRAGSTTVTSGFTPLTFNADTTTQYSISVANYGTHLFNHWNTGSTNATLLVTPAQASTLTAFYSG